MQLKLVTVPELRNILVQALFTFWSIIVENAFNKIIQMIRIGSV